MSSSKDSEVAVRSKRVMDLWHVQIHQHGEWRTVMMAVREGDADRWTRWFREFKQGGKQ